MTWNLLSNAIKFTPRGGKVQVVLERVDSQVEIRVADTGMGIKPEFLQHVFERFRQADASTTRQVGGLGLGLSIVKQLVELHGGTVTARSAGENHGTTFTLRLPLRVVGQVSDIGMPGMDGYQLLERMTVLLGGRLPAIALTALARSQDRTRALRAGFTVHVSKPVEPMELVATVASVAGRKS